VDFLVTVVKETALIGNACAAELDNGRIKERPRRRKLEIDAYVKVEQRTGKYCYLRMLKSNMRSQYCVKNEKPN